MSTTATTPSRTLAPTAMPASPARPAVDPQTLGTFLLGRWADLRAQARATAADEQFHKIEGLPAAEHRERVLAQMRALAERGQVLRGFPERLGGADDPGGNLAGFEELLVADPSLQIKAGVQWGLFGAAILHLGTPAQQDAFLPGAMSLAVPGAFAMTETGHGSDVASIATTATYDPQTEEFVIHTPFRGAWKDYLGNAAVHASAAVVFAQLITGGVNHGVHVFYVPIRTPGATGPEAFLPGIGGQDDGAKGGLNGIDNGRLHFDHVRVPRANLLARYAHVDADGTYSSPIHSPGRRFFTMLGSLVQGRVSLDGAASNAAKVGLAIAIRYGAERRQFAGPAGGETVLLDYASHQRRLLIPLAEAYATHCAHDQLLDLFDEVFSGRQDTPERRMELETTAAVLKATSTRFALDTLQECREACGGAGFLTANRITSLRADMDVYATFEGDNTVLLQLVAKRLIGAYGAQFTGAAKGRMARVVVERAADATLHRTPLRRVAQAVADGGDMRRAVGHVRDADMQHTLLADRVDTMVAEVADALRPARKASPQRAAAIVNAHQAQVIALARAHADLVRWEAFTEALPRVPGSGNREILTVVRDVFGLSVIERDLAWFLIHGRMTAQRARSVTSYLNRLLARLRPSAVDLVDAFGFGPEHLRAEIATGAEQARQEEARDYLRRERAAGRTARWEADVS